MFVVFSLNSCLTRLTATTLAHVNVVLKLHFHFLWSKAFVSDIYLLNSILMTSLYTFWWSLRTSVSTFCLILMIYSTIVNKITLTIDLYDGVTALCTLNFALGLSDEMRVYCYSSDGRCLSLISAGALLKIISTLYKS